MKKSLVALAALAATSAFAQSSVTISGNADVAYGTKEAINGAGKTYAKATGAMDGFNAPNRIIISVTEDLGGGLKAKFLNEHGISPTNTQDWATRQNNGAPTVNGTDGKVSATTADTQIPMMGFQTAGTNRGTYVALEGGFGEVRAGYLVSQFYNMVAQSGYFFGSENYGALLQNFGLGEVGGSRANGLQYTAPKMGDFTLSAQKSYGAERTWESDTADTAVLKSKAERVSFRIDWANGPAAVSYVRTNYDADSTKQVTTTAPTGSVFGVAGAAVTSTATNATQKNNADTLAAKYTIGNLTGTLHYNKATLNSSIDANDRKLSSTQYGVQYAMGNTSFFAITGSGDAKKTDGTKVNDITNTQYGVRYALSKRTTAYLMTGTSKDKAVAATDVTLAKKASFSGFGLSHAF